MGIFVFIYLGKSIIPKPPCTFYGRSVNPRQFAPSWNLSRHLENSGRCVIIISSPLPLSLQLCGLSAETFDPRSRITQLFQHFLCNSTMFNHATIDIDALMIKWHIRICHAAYTKHILPRFHKILKWRLVCYLGKDITPQKMVTSCFWTQAKCSNECKCMDACNSKRQVSPFKQHFIHFS